MIDQAYLKSILSYNPETGDFTWIKAKRNKNLTGKKAGSLYSNGSKKYWQIKISGKPYLAHRLAFLYQTGSFPKHEVDHLNGNGLQNNWGNLREATRQQNGRNRRQQSSNSSGCTGVTWASRKGKWQAQIWVKGKTIFLGLFDELDDAVAARKMAESDHDFHANHGTVRPL